MLQVDGKKRIVRSYARFLTDESSLAGSAPRRLCFPETVDELALLMRETDTAGTPMTISGSRTGIAGGAVPKGADTLISLERIVFEPLVRYDAETEEWRVHVGAGTTLKELNEALRRRRFSSTEDPPPGIFYPVDPTETGASVGGSIACNASGARTYGYGPTRKWVTGLKVVLADGEVLDLRRSPGLSSDSRSGSIDTRADGFAFRFHGDLHRLPEISIPPVKHVAGYHITPDMEMIDLFIGGEGTLGIVAEAELRLATPKKHHLYLSLFPPDEAVLPLVDAIRESTTLDPVAVEYVDPPSLDLLRSYRRSLGEASGVPALPERAESVVYLEFDYDESGTFDALAQELTRTVDRLDFSADASWAGFNGQTLVKMKTFRHALPERINAIIAARKRSIPTLTKVSTDMAVPWDRFPEMLEAYRRGVVQEGLDAYIFGHIGNGHVHVNILPGSEEELDRARELYREFAVQAVALGGSVAAEHGIGRLKKPYMDVQFSSREREGLRAVKKVFDPRGRLNPGVLF